MDSLGDIAAFVRTAERLSFVEAGRDLRLSASAVGKAVARLEAELGVRLFHRTTRKVSLTEEGALLQARCRGILDDLREAEALVTQSRLAPRGILRISLPIIGYRFLLPVLPEFQKRYPEIELDLDFNDRLIDLVEAGVDAAIRSGTLVDSSLMARRLGPFRFVLCAAPSYLDRAGTPRCPAELAGHAALRFRFPSSGKLQDWTLAEPLPAGLYTALTCNNMEALRAAAIGGLGIGYMPDFLAESALREGGLTRILDPYLTDPGQFSILWSSGRHMSARLRAFVDFVGARLFQAG
ncbi:LysR substrate-binding domain-containing protein [Methylobacterium sp. J-072]|uniref:LysR substrate-binding domain-containing protein n=1 Tax=Methylobacterium sp. J-072 TaxID=2836651 RepID=UPI001FBBDED8|nr:LysR substrate-binding domain-containing protein [Methylobacterium sp. J-072]MCJ2094351.1 LysR substrate-binding domain-containing protein [Methylobacterium sp. J-072]